MSLIRKIAILLILVNSVLIQAQDLDREFRGVWIATVDNIDWPSKNTLNSNQQKEEFIKLLDFFKELNFNAIIFQVRPSADAFYNSSFEPWSSYLSGSLGKAPIPYYDPLGFMIEEAHKRGMEFHAWLNPYRAVVNFKDVNSSYLVKKKPEWFINYGKNTYFNPGIPEVRTYTNKIVSDLVRQYDIDAVHFDDYFYPYKIANTPFPDQKEFEKYGQKHYPNQLENWRRDNVNTIIKELRTTIKTLKPWVQFGISPFGVWRNKSVDPEGSETKAGQTNYDDLYADIRLWLKNGWLDYVLPQDYWHIGFELADYEKVVRWWNANNFETNLYIGQAMYRQSRATTEAWQAINPTETEKQLDLNKTLKNIQGTVYFSAKSFAKNTHGINDILKNKYYSSPILPPSIKGNSQAVPEAVHELKLTKLKRRNYRLNWKVIPENTAKEAVKFLVYQYKSKAEMQTSNSNLIAITGNHELMFTKKELKENGKYFKVQSVSRNNVLGKVSLLN